MEKMKKKTMVGWIAAVVSIAVLVTTMSIGIYFINREHRSNKLTIENIYQENLFALSESLSNIEVNMSKLVISNSNIETAVLLNDTYHHSMAASRALGVLPLDPVEMRVTDRFLNQLGDWCMATSRSFMSNLSAEESGDAVVASAFAAAGAEVNPNTNPTNSMAKLNSADGDSDSKKGYGEVSSDKSADKSSDRSTDKSNDKSNDKSKKADIENAEIGQEKTAKGLTTFDEQCEEFFYRTQRLNEAVKSAAEGMDGSFRLTNRLEGGYLGSMHLDDLGLISLGNTVAKTDGGNDANRYNETDLPQIIYDGPFSDGQNQKSFKCLEGKDELSEQAAAQKAEKVFESLGLRQLNKVGETSSPRAYLFDGVTNKTEMFVCVSVQGGMIISATLPCDNTGKVSRLGENDAKEKAAEYAKMCGYDGLTPVWYTSAAGYAVVNFTPIKEGVIYYPDLVKVKVCLVTGDFAGLEALGYCACCHERGLSPTITKEEAQRAVSGKLSISGARLAVIPKNMKEFLCYEFAAEYKGMDYLVYIDATTGKQVNIMRIMDGEQGKIVM